MQNKTKQLTTLWFVYFGKNFQHYTLYHLSDMNSQVIPNILCVAFLSDKYREISFSGKQRQMFHEGFYSHKTTSPSLPHYSDTWTRTFKNCYFRKLGKNWGKCSNPSRPSLVQLDWSSHCYVHSPLYSCCCTSVFCPFLQMPFLIFASFIPLPTPQSPLEIPFLLNLPNPAHFTYPRLACMDYCVLCLAVHSSYNLKLFQELSFLGSVVIAWRSGPFKFCWAFSIVFSAVRNHTCACLQVIFDWTHPPQSFI